MIIPSRFLSTPSARRATSCIIYFITLDTYFYPRPPRGGRLNLLKKAELTDVISIHALREEGDSSTMTVKSPC